jgi:hypothetical protein
MTVQSAYADCTAQNIVTARTGRLYGEFIAQTIKPIFPDRSPG